jgi:hypothetical protein
MSGNRLWRGGKARGLRLAGARRFLQPPFNPGWPLTVVTGPAGRSLPIVVDGLVTNLDSLKHFAPRRVRPIDCSRIQQNAIGNWTEGGDPPTDGKLARNLD